MDARGEIAVRCVGVVKTFGTLTALDHLDLEVPAGQVVGFLGPNGSGKSTTIRILLDLARADAGTVSVLGSDPRTGDPAVRRRIGYLPGELRLDERLTVGETFRSWSRLRGGGVDPDFVDELCDRVGLDQARATKGLSTGNRRKVGLVGAFMARPELLVLDEPTSGLDPLVQATFAELVREARDEGRTVFLSSHVLDEMQHVADHVIVLRAGAVVATGSLDELLHLAGQPFRATFPGPPPADAVRLVPGVSDLRVEGADLVGVQNGPPGRLLEVLAAAGVLRLLMPEPELEDAFLRFYGDATERGDAS